MERIDWIATVLAVIGTLLLIQIFPVLNGLWSILVFFVIAGLVGGLLRLRRGEGRSSSSLSSTAQETLKITRRVANGARTDEPPRESLVRQALHMAGHKNVSERDLNICLWPDRTALLVAEDFFVGNKPLTRLQRPHVRNEFAAAKAYYAVKSALLVALADHVTPEQHALAIAWNAQIGTWGFDEMYSAAREDIAEVRTRGIAEPVATYVAGIYLASILRADSVDRYFPAEADVEGAVADASLRLGVATAGLAALTVR